ncbi:unnamed protein product [Blepharisma stoltei]|uniref:F-box domain-containing protein n=1 Tax=Blepharisma stoltei TaxID=1481888 RepID=A0AAU9JHS7_9CILI|nr:unnamed protein product [Blepharisma stoltei]
MNVLDNCDLLGGILSYLNPFELISLQTVSKTFNHVSRTHWEIEKSFTNMISELFWTKDQIENPAIKIMTGLFNTIKWGERLIFNIQLCKVCSRICGLGFTDWVIGKMHQSTPNGIITHKQWQLTSIVADGVPFILLIANPGGHKCRNMKWDESLPNSTTNCEWFAQFPRKAKLKSRLHPFIWQVAECERSYNSKFENCFKVSSNIFENRICVGAYCEFIFPEYCNLISVVPIFKDTCKELSEKYNELYYFKGKRKIVQMMIELAQRLHHLGVIEYVTVSHKKVDLDTRENIEYFYAVDYLKVYALGIPEKYTIKNYPRRAPSNLSAPVNSLLIEARQLNAI